MWMFQLFMVHVLLLLSECKTQTFGQFIWKQNKKQDTSWSACSVTCGEGHLEARIDCYDIVHETYVDDSKCKGIEKPVYTKVCKPKPCESQFPGYWYLADWGECSVSCGTGVISRMIACINHAGSKVLEDKDCPNNKPVSYEMCVKDKCPTNADWIVSTWSKCSAKCDGIRTRKVLCKSEIGKQIQQSNCKKKKPFHQEKCSPACAKWVAGTWGRCRYNKRKRSCSEAKQTRCVLCVDKKTFELSTKCIEGLKPKDKRNCGNEACLNA